MALDPTLTTEQIKNMCDDLQQFCEEDSGRVQVRLVGTEQ
jgi:hypothetical protein